jgi:hypothetical protein
MDNWNFGSTVQNFNTTNNTVCHYEWSWLILNTPPIPTIYVLSSPFLVCKLMFFKTVTHKTSSLLAPHLAICPTKCQLYIFILNCSCIFRNKRFLLKETPYTKNVMHFYSTVSRQLSLTFSQQGNKAIFTVARYEIGTGILHISSWICSNILETRQFLYGWLWLES